MKIPLTMICCGALLWAPPALATAEVRKANMERCIDIAKKLDRDLKTRSADVMVPAIKLFDDMCLKEYGCPDFEKIRNMEVAIQPEVGSEDPGLYERLIYDAKNACHW